MMTDIEALDKMRDLWNNPNLTTNTVLDGMETILRQVRTLSW